MQGCYPGWHMWGVAKVQAGTYNASLGRGRADLPAGGPLTAVQRMHSDSHVLLDLQPVPITDGVRDNLLGHGSLMEKGFSRAPVLSSGL